METTIQQVIQYPTCDQSMSGLNATIARTNNFTMEGLDANGTPTWGLPLHLQGLAYGGLMGFDLSSYVSVRCSSGNCSIADFWTIGYGSQCHETTSELHIFNTTGVDTYIETTYLWPSNNLSIKAANGSMLNPFLASYVVNSSLAFGDFDAWQPWGAVVQILMSNNLEGVYAVECQLQPALQRYSSDIVCSTVLRLLFEHKR